jgi:hypothetical protein
LTVLNFANEQIAGTVRSEKLPSGAHVSDMFTGDEVGVVDDLHSFAVELLPHQGMSLLVQQPMTEDDSSGADYSEPGARSLPSA